MIRRPPRSTRTDTLFPYTTLFRSYGREYCRRVSSGTAGGRAGRENHPSARIVRRALLLQGRGRSDLRSSVSGGRASRCAGHAAIGGRAQHLYTDQLLRSEEPQSELHTLMRTSYAVIGLKKKN